MTTPKPIPNSLREYRSRAGMLQIDVAHALGLTSSDRISHWEKGQMFPHLTNRFKLAVLYGVAPQELYYGLFEVAKQEVQEWKLDRCSLDGWSTQKYIGRRLT